MKAKMVLKKVMNTRQKVVNLFNHWGFNTGLDLIIN